MTEQKTFTEDDVNNIIANVQFKERVVSAMLTAIQRSIAAGDDPKYTDVLRVVLAAQMPKPPEPVAEEPKDGD